MTSTSSVLQTGFIRTDFTINNMGDRIFIATSRDGKEIRLTEKQWKHISIRHPEMARNINEIKQAIEGPEFISWQSENVQKFYIYLKSEEKYIMVAVRILNGDGFVITAYKTKKIQYGKKDNI